MSAMLRLHAFVAGSRVNGPGARAVLWTQGCSLNCPGCFNPETHSGNHGELISIDDLFARLLKLNRRIEGITISGGEPLQQLRPLLALLQRVRTETALSSILFSGYAWAEIHRMPDAEKLLACVDVVIAGRYDASQGIAHGLLGSANKTAHFLTDRYTPADLQAVPPAEIIITAEGEIVLSGIEPVQW